MSERFRRGIHVLEWTKNTAVLSKWESANIDFICFANKGVNHRHQKSRPGIPRDSPRFVFQFAKAAVDRSCVETYETCQVELWWLLLLADNFRRQNVEVQCFVAVSLSHDKKKNEETPQHSAKILTYKNSVEKPIKIVCAIELKLH